MAVIIFHTISKPTYQVIHFESSDLFSPEDLKSLRPPNPIAEDFAHKGVILSGRGPIWLFGFLVHFYHPTAWLATYDPRLQGAVVVESHSPAVEVGEVIPVAKNDVYVS